MKRFFTSMFTDKDGSISSKRIILVALVLTFLIIVYVNLFTKKIIDPVLLSPLVTLIWYYGGLVFGENITDVVKKINTVNPTEQK